MKTVFLSFKSLLDRNSGAAMELRSVFEALSYNTTCLSFSFNCYDMGDDYTADELIDKRLAPTPGKRALYHFDDNGIRHYLFVGASKDTMKLTQADMDTFLAKGEQFLRAERPNNVVFFGSNELLPLLRVAKNVGAQIIFYAGTAAYEQERHPLFNLADRVVVPSQFIGELYKGRFGIKYEKIPTTLGFEPEAPDVKLVDARRAIGAITLINPAPDKGGHFFFNLAGHHQLRDRSFFCVESRSTRRFWREAGIDVDRLENVYWIPWQSDIRQILRKTAVLAMPSLINEAAGKVVAEAMALGVPSLGYDIGGIKEQIGAGGVVLPFAQCLAASPETGLYESAVPPEPVEAWAKALEQILEDPEEYRALSTSAFAEARKYQRSETTKKWKTILGI